MPENKSPITPIDVLKALGGISALGILKELLEDIIKGFLGLEGSAGRITAFWMLFIAITLILWLIDYFADKKMSKASIFGIILMLIGAIWGTTWAINAPAEVEETPTPIASVSPISPENTISLSPTATETPLGTTLDISSTVPPIVIPTKPPMPKVFLGGGSGQLIFSAWQNNSQYNSQIYLLNLGTGLDTIDADHIINLSNNLTIDKEPSWSPDGSQILFVSQRDNNPEIYLMDADGQNQVNISRHPDRDYQPVWSPDGYYIAFSSYRGPGKNQDIFIMKGNGTDIRQISATGGYYQDPAWSRDSQKVFFIGWDEDHNKDKAEIFVYDIPTDSLEKLTDLDKLALSPDVSPDGKMLVFVSTYAGFKNLFLIGTDGYNLQQLTQQTKTNYIEPAWSPDGKWIAFVAEEEDNQNTLYLFNLETRKKYAIITLTGLRNPAWRP
ncbi:MAG: hypothetical protein Fur0018_20810 [Anaerolineales bacterium]